ncbi:MAG: glycosyl hydrolase, partial [Planctomycetota bacterium]|nr:glycosyl hydrolase [Planctomycetota bacterium]
VLWGGGLQGPRVVPGIYTATLTQGDASETVEFEIRKDPRCSVSDEDLQAQFEFLIGVRDKLTETHEMIKQLREVKGQIESLSQRLKGENYQAIREQGQDITDRLSAIEKKLYQTQNQSPQDPLNFPIRLNNRLSSLVGVVSMGDNAPTRQSIEVRDVLVSEINALLTEAKQILSQDVQAFNQKVSATNVPAIFVDNQ